jgi:hypothetical protein
VETKPLKRENHHVEDNKSRIQEVTHLKQPPTTTKANPLTIVIGFK